MVIIKAPTKHGLDRKFKPWRRGKSEKSNKRSSLKQQLRGMERLLQKLPDTDKERREELQVKVRALQLEIEEKQKVISEKKNAEKAHGQRFLDRQRLTRLEKQARKQQQNSDAELLKIALDQVYVAHHPTDVKYMPLFRKGQRVVDTSRHLYRRAVTRRRILKELVPEKQNCPWISKDQYQRLPKEIWTIQDEERIFGGSITRQGMKEVKKKLQTSKEDARFTLAPQHDVVLQAAEEVNAELDEGESDFSNHDSDSDAESSLKDVTKIERRSSAKNDDVKKTKAKVDSESEGVSEDSDSDDDDTDEVDPLKRLQQGTHGSIKTSEDRNAKKLSTASESSETSSSDSDSDSDASEHQVGKVQKQQTMADRVVESDSDSSSDDSSDEEGEKVEQKRKREVAQPKKTLEEDEGDDFLMDAKEDEDENVFSMTLKQVPALGDARGDKSKGWETQRQRPGQFKKRRVRN